MLFRIEKSKFRQGEYVGYACGLVWTITRSNSSFGNWVARHYATNRHVFAMRLKDLDTKLDELEKETGNVGKAA